MGRERGLPALEKGRLGGNWMSERLEHKGRTVCYVGVPRLNMVGNELRG